MNDETVLRVPNPCSDNQKSAIQSPKWWGIFVIAVAFAICGAVVEAQQPKKTHRIGYLSLGLGIQPNEEAFLQRLRELGYNLAILTGRTSSLSGDLPKAKPIFFLSLPPNWSV